MGELDEAHKNWLERKDRRIESLKRYVTALEVAAMFSRDEKEKNFYNGVRTAIVEAIVFIQNGEI